MSETALRQLLAQFVIEVDKAGALAKGNAAVDALKKRIEELQASAKPAARAVNDALGSIGEKAGQLAARNLQALGAKGLIGAGRSDSNPFAAAGAAARSRLENVLGLSGRSNGDAFAGLSGLSRGIASGAMGAHFGPTRATMEDGRRAMAQAEAAAARYASTLRGRLAGAVQAVRAGFAGGGGGGGGGPGLIDTLATARNGLIALAGSAVVAGVKRVVDHIGDIADNAARLGVSTEEVQRLGALAETSGTSVQALGTAFRTLATNAVGGTKESAEAFAELGVATQNADGSFRSRQELFFATAKALADVGDETKRAQLAQKLFGRSALELAPLLNEGSDAIERQRKELASLPVLSDSTVKATEALGDQWALTGKRVLAASEPLLKLLVPALATLTDVVTKVVGGLGKLLSQTDFVSVAVTALGAALYWKVIPGFQLMMALCGGTSKAMLGLAGSAGKAVLSFARLALPLLLIEDFITFLRGGDSETGRLLDALFGKGTAEGTVQTIHDLAEAFQDLWRWITGDGAGEKAKKLFQEIDDGLTVMTGDLLAKLGIGQGGLAALHEKHAQRATIEGWADSLMGRPSTTEMAVPALPPVGTYGPPTADGSARGNAPMFGDTHVTVNMGPSATPGEVGRAVVGAETEERNRLAAAYGGF